MSNAFPNTIKNQGTHPMIQRYMPAFIKQMEVDSVFTKRVKQITPRELIGRHLNAVSIIFPGSILEATNIVDGIKPKQTTSVYSEIDVIDVSGSLLLDNFEMYYPDEQASMVLEHVLTLGSEFKMEEEFLLISQIKEKGIKSLQTKPVDRTNAYETILAETPRFKRTNRGTKNITMYISSAFNEMLKLDSIFTNNVISDRTVLEEGVIARIDGIKIVELFDLDMVNILYFIGDDDLFCTGHAFANTKSLTFPGLSIESKISLIPHNQLTHPGTWGVVGRAQMGCALKLPTGAVYREAV